ncbi:hypothetical protein A6770_38340 [Nostoc minutum NIES-26]|uniref:Low-complexity protein n=1 Tax=Nostoc minutum NIES-26 TaxID=1844469 RepID=A0A367RWI9_9NOSO|nr:hypothetical protein A6770_38340 [Nostoc minutum NIES-26]
MQEHRHSKNQSFKGRQDLVDADFSHADIRGVDFTKANLTGANFSCAKAGLKWYWAIIWLTVSFTLALLSGLSWMIGGIFAVALLDKNNIEIYNIFPGVIVLVILLIFLSILVRKGFTRALVTGTLIFTIAGAAAFACVVSGNQKHAAAIVFGGIALTVAEGGFLIGIGTMALAVAGSKAVIEFLALPIVGSGFITGIVLIIFVDWKQGLEHTLLSGFVTLLNSYIVWRAFTGDEIFTWTSKISVFLTAIGGTSFYGANLTNTDFTEAILKNTDFRNAKMTRACWYQSKKLDLARVGKTYLEKPQIQELLITGFGKDKNFDGIKLRGINLHGANLADASFIGTDLSEANLQDADLSRAKLVQTQLDGTDFTGATLTGAYIEDWGVTHDTNFDGVRCEYVYMRLPTKENPDPLRKPDNRQEVFADGEFGDFIKPIFDTLDLYHNQGVDPRAIAISFKQLVNKHPDAELEIVALEKRSENNFLLRAKTVPTANKSQLSAEYFELYNKLKALPKEDLIFLLAQQDGQIQSLEVAFKAVNQGLIAVSETPRRVVNNYLQQAQIAGGLVNADTVTAGQIGGNITNYNPEQKQNLAQAAADIQQLLNQLSQSYPTATTSEKMSVVAKAVDEIESNPTLKARVIGALKAGGTEAFKELIDNPLINILLASIDGWQEAE